MQAGARTHTHTHTNGTAWCKQAHTHTDTHIIYEHPLTRGRCFVHFILWGLVWTVLDWVALFWFSMQVRMKRYVKYKVFCHKGSAMKGVPAINGRRVQPCGWSSPAAGLALWVIQPCGHFSLVGGGPALQRIQPSGQYSPVHSPVCGGRRNRWKKVKQLLGVV